MQSCSLVWLQESLGRGSPESRFPTLGAVPLRQPLTPWTLWALLGPLPPLLVSSGQPLLLPQSLPLGCPREL